jgi:hypothetical protein
LDKPFCFLLLLLFALQKMNSAAGVAGVSTDKAAGSMQGVPSSLRRMQDAYNKRLERNVNRMLDSFGTILSEAKVPLIYWNDSSPRKLFNQRLVFSIGIR